MKVVDLGNGAVAFEPDASDDRFSAFNVARLKSAGMSESTIDLCIRFAGIEGSLEISHAEAPTPVAQDVCKI